MKTKFLMIAAGFMAAAVCFTPQTASAAESKSVSTVTATTQTRRKLGWVREGGKWYCYRANGEKARGLVAYKHNWYYTDKQTGAMVTGWVTLNGKPRYFRKAGGYMIRSGLWRLDGKLYYFQHTNTILTDGTLTKGWQTIKNKDYYFGDDGAAVSGFHVIDGTTYYFRAKICYKATGWLTINGKRYHFNTSDSSRANGAMDTGLVTIDGSQYFFDEKGVMITDDFDANGKHYSFSADGKCTITDANSGSNDADDSSNTNKDGLSDEFLFFTIYESGRSDDFYQGYNQTGGDHGNACGKYQFDYRYSLLPFVKYCYQKDPVFFREFKIYASLSLLQKSKLQGNTAFYRAWNTIFSRNKVKFANYQDQYAKQEYYDITERYLSKYGIDMSKRPDVVKGAVYSYSIQHGQLSAANTVIAAKISNSSSDSEFLRLLYYYRMKQYPAYVSRYRSEYAQALSLLRKAA